MPDRNRAHSILLLLLGFALGVCSWIALGRGERPSATREAARAVEHAPGPEPAPAAPAVPVAGDGADSTSLRAPEGPSRVQLAQLSREPRPAVRPAVRPDRRDPSAAELEPFASRQERIDLLQRLQRGSSDEERLAAARALLAAGPEGLGAVRAIDVLAELDPAAVAPALRSWVDRIDEGLEVRHLLASAIRARGQDGEVVSRDDLLYFYEHGTTEVRLAAATTLEARGDDSLAQAYTRERAKDLASGDPEVRAEAVRELAALGGRAGLELLVPLLSDRNEEVRLQALLSVRQMPSSEALPHVRALVDDPSARVRAIAERMVEMLERRASFEGDPAALGRPLFERRDG